MCFGDPSAGLKSQIGDLAKQTGARQQQSYNAAFPGLQQTAQQGLPFMNQLMDFSGGTAARAAAPGRAQIARRAAMSGQNSNSPAVQQSQADYSASTARGFDDSMRQNLLLNQAAKTGAQNSLMGASQINDPAKFFALLTQLGLGT